MLKVKVRKLNSSAKIPTYAKQGDAGLDFYTVECYMENGNVVYKTGIAVEVPEGHVGLLFPRSSIASKELILSNSVGVIDSGYRGEVIFKFKPTKKGLDFSSTLLYNSGDRVGQLIIMPYPTVELEEVEELSTSERGIGGYGSTGN